MCFIFTNRRSLQRSALLIQTLLTTRMAARDNEEEDCNKADESDADAEIPALPYRPDDMRTLLRRSASRQHLPEEYDWASSPKMWLTSLIKPSVLALASAVLIAPACLGCTAGLYARCSAHIRSRGVYSRPRHALPGFAHGARDVHSLYEYAACHSTSFDWHHGTEGRHCAKNFAGHLCT